MDTQLVCKNTLTELKITQPAGNIPQSGMNITESEAINPERKAKIPKIEGCIAKLEGKNTQRKRKITQTGGVRTQPEVRNTELNGGTTQTGCRITKLETENTRPERSTGLYTYLNNISKMHLPPRCKRGGNYTKEQFLKG